tara:strand:- start:658 stop:1788 length:1131 start_codon:yes stop_codon:yes gene_type:complete
MIKTSQIRQAREFLKRADPIRNGLAQDPIALYIGAAASKNLGDILLFDAIKKLLKGVSLIPNCPTGSFKDTRSQIAMRKSIDRLLRFGRRVDAVVIGGGTLLNDRYFHSLINFYAAGNDLPVYVVGTGVESIDLYGDNLHQVLPVLERSLFTGLRDQTSAQLISDLGIECQTIGDPVVLLHQPIARTVKSPTHIGLNVGCDFGKMLAEQERINCIVDALLSSEKYSNCQFEFFCMHPNDVSVAKQIVRAHPNRRLSVGEVFTGLNDCEQSLSRYDMVISQRLHGVVCATSMGIPSISLAYRPKCIRYMESVGMAEFVVNLSSEKSTDEFFAMLTSFFNNYADVNASLVKNVTQLQDQINLFGAKVSASIRQQAGFK